MSGQKKSSFSPPALGGASLLVIFAVLALTVFALLSLSTVRADGRLSEAAAQAVQDFYAADCEAQAVLAWLRTGEGEENLPEDLAVETTLQNFAGRSEAVHAFVLPISGTQELQVEVRVDGPEDWEVLRWQAVPAGDWEVDEGIDLWDMEIF